MANKRQGILNIEVEGMFNNQCSIFNFQLKGKRDVSATVVFLSTINNKP